MGTPDYVAPEVLSYGMVADHRADLYAVGVMLYQMLTGEVPRGIFKLPSEKGIGSGSALRRHHLQGDGAGPRGALPERDGCAPRARCHPHHATTERRRHRHRVRESHPAEACGTAAAPARRAEPASGSTSARSDSRSCAEGQGPAEKAIARYPVARHRRHRHGPWFGIILCAGRQTQTSSERHHRHCLCHRTLREAAAAHQSAREPECVGSGFWKAVWGDRIGSGSNQTLRLLRSAPRIAAV